MSVLPPPLEEEEPPVDVDVDAFRFTVETTDWLLTTRITELPVSATTIELETISAWGWLNKAYVVVPSREPEMPAMPAIVETTPLVLIRRMELLPVSAT